MVHILPSKTLSDSPQAGVDESVFQAETRREVQVVGDDNQNGLLTAVQFQQQSCDRFRGFVIQVSRRLVTQDKLRFPHQGAHQSNALFLAARQLVRAVTNPGAKAHLLQQIESSALRPTFDLPRNQGWNEDIFQDGALGQEVVVLEHETDLLVAECGEAYLI
jgi:hypothetical protein